MFFMGLLATRWEGQHEGHALVVARNELTKGFKLEFDGKEIASRTWSWVGLGELHATVEYGERSREVRVKIEWGGLAALSGKCDVTVDGVTVPLELAR